MKIKPYITSEKYNRICCFCLNWCKTGIVVLMDKIPANIYIDILNSRRTMPRFARLPKSYGEVQCQVTGKWFYPIHYLELCQQCYEYLISDVVPYELVESIHSMKIKDRREKTK